MLEGGRFVLPVAAMSFSASSSVANPAGSSVLVAAVSWLQNTVLGTVATTIAVIAIAVVGLMAISGRVSIRYGVTVVAGCFILFGAPAIVAGILSFVGGGGSYSSAPPPSAMAAPPPALPALPPPLPYDPYAGASVPTG
jgi:type IV secretory pathway VirB2 component (pilin)